jgi:hypothetical protein
LNRVKVSKTALVRLAVLFTALLATIALIGLTGMVSAEAAGMVSAKANAATCSTASHCYGIARWESSPETAGSAGSIDSTCLWVGDPSTDFVDQEIWQGTDSAPYADYWVEAGETYGNPNGGVRSWFWARNRPGSNGYAQFFPSGTVNLSTSYEFQFSWVSGTNEWQVTAPWGTSTATSNPPYGKWLQAGSEITDNSNRTNGDISSLDYLDTSFSEHFGWSGASVHDLGGDTTTTWVGSGNKHIHDISSC